MENRNLSASRRRFITRSVALATTLQLRQAARALGISPGTEVCSLTAEQEEGPYYIAGEHLRSDIAEGKAGVPFALRITVLDARTCQPLTNAAVDLWHCDALGLYSGFTKQNPMGPGGPPPDFDPEHPGNRPGPPEGFGPPPGSPGGPPENHPTDKLTFLRGVQLTGSDGTVRFETIFPGFYMGRTNHIHLKVRVGGHTSGQAYEAGHTSHTGQIFFPEDMATELMQHPPYSQHTIHRTTLREDGVFGEQKGELSMARLQAANSGQLAAGLHAEFVAAVDPAASPAAAGRRRGPGGRPPRPEAD